MRRNITPLAENQGPPARRSPPELLPTEEVTLLLATTPGWESAVELSFRRHWDFQGRTTPGRPDVQLKRIHGGVEVRGPWEELIHAVSRQRIANRIWLRLTQFRARDFPRLFRDTSAVPWGRYFPRGVEVAVRSATHGSRLKMKKRIEETIHKAIQRSYRTESDTGTNAPQSLISSESAVEILARIESDIVTLSLDLAGGLIHQRGEKANVGTAPLRETWAAGIVEQLFSLGELPNHGQVHMVDPMAGTGTFLNEIVSRGELDSRLTRWLQMKPQACDPMDTWRPKRLIAMDQSDRAIASLKENLSVFRVDGPSEIQIIRQDVMSNQQPWPIEKSAESEFWVVTNPPWNHRLKLGKNPADWYSELMAHIESQLKPTRVALVLPRTTMKQIRCPSDWKSVSLIPFSAGGIPVTAVFFKRI